METVDQTSKKKKRIVFFGDSLTAGYGLDEEYSFPSLVQAKIDSLVLDYEVVNAGISGDTSAGGVSRIDWILEQPLAVFVLELGANDALRGFDPGTTATNLQKIIDAVYNKYPDAKVVLAGMEAPPNMGDDYTKSFRNIFPKLAQQNKAGLIPFLLDGVAGDPTLNLTDGKHPNAIGQQIVRDNVWAIISPLL